MPEYEGKEFQNVAKEGVTIDDGEMAKEGHKALEEEYKPLTDWLNRRLAETGQIPICPRCLVLWMDYAKDPTQDFYATQKKTFEINPRHPVIKELLKRVTASEEDVTATSTAFPPQDQVGFADRIEAVLRQPLDVSQDAQAEKQVEKSPMRPPSRSSTRSSKPPSNLFSPIALCSFRLVT